MKLVEWVNDWRDKLYYSIAFIYCCFLHYPHFSPFNIFYNFSNYIFYRECARMMTWAFLGQEEARATCFILILTVNSLSIPITIMAVPDILNNQMLVGLFLFFVLANTGLCLFILHKKGWKLKNVFRAWFKLLFDYPRKQKPPKKRDPVGKRLKSFIDRFAPDYIPVPA